MKDYSFKNYLISKRNVIIILLLINSFAFVVNLLGLEGGFYQQGIAEETKVFCDISGGDYEFKHLSKFWPFVRFTNRGFNYETYSNLDVFRGVFRYYDLSEFLIYTILLFIILYFRWDYNYKNGSDLSKNK